MCAKVDDIGKVGQAVECINPEIAALVPDYFLDLLPESGAEVVEHHLSDCVECRERYLTLVRVRGAARKRRMDGRGSDENPVSHETEFIPKRKR